MRGFPKIFFILEAYISNAFDYISNLFFSILFNTLLFNVGNSHYCFPNYKLFKMGKTKRYRTVSCVTDSGKLVQKRKARLHID